MKQLKQVWYIAMKDLKIFSRDRASLFFFLVFPFLFIILFTFLFQGAGAEDNRIELHLATREATGGLSYQIIGAVATTNESLLKAGDPIIIQDMDYEAARQAVADKELEGVLIFPADFTEAVMSGASTDLEVFTDASATYTRAALSSMAGAISSQISTNKVVIDATVRLLVSSGAIPADKESIDRAVQKLMGEAMFGGAMGGGESYLAYKIENIGDVEAGNASDFVIPGYLVMFVFFAAAISAERIVWERKNNTLERILASSVKRGSILAGIYTGTVIKGLVQIVIFWVVGILAFSVDLGLSPLAVIILSILMVIMSAAFSLMLATLARTIRSAASLAVLTSLLLAPLGGCWWPFFLYPEWLQNIAKITPHAWATEGFNKLMLFGANFGDAVPSMVALLVFTVIFGSIAVWRFRTSAT
ncbi:MAG: ABC transporter permease [Dehalococcoidales bacterium]|nr:ABC transporter permease [Dehalococcoidales bacterium]